MRLGAAALVVVSAGFLASTVAPSGWGEPIPRGDSPTVYRTVTERVNKRIERIGVEGWHARAVHNRRALNRAGKRLRANRREVTALRASIRKRWAPTAREVVTLAAIAYGQSSSTLLRKGECESHWNPNALNASGAGGWFQFLASTWAGTPYAGFSRFDPLAASLAAAWMHEQGRGGEWVCR